MNSVEVYDPVKKCHYRILVSQKLCAQKAQKAEPARIEISDDDDDKIVLGQAPTCYSNIAIWTQNETLALINIFSLHKNKFKSFRKKRGQWKLISGELAKIGINKAPEKCEIKWKNLLRVYRQRKQDNKGPGKFEFFNELDDIIAKDPQYKYLIANANNSSIKNPKSEDGPDITKDKELLNLNSKMCSCVKSEKQKRHEDRMALMAKKMEIEERKVKAFEDYLQFLRGNSEGV